MTSQKIMHAKVHPSKGTADYAETWEWAQLDLQSIQHRDYFGHLSIFIFKTVFDWSVFDKKRDTFTRPFNLTTGDINWQVR